MTIVTLDAVSKSYHGAKALDEVSLSIRRGERLVILGPSGCGKTTVLRLIAGFIAPDSGRVTLAGETVSEYGRILLPPERRHLGMVFQDLALWPHLSVRGNIEFGLKAQGLRRPERDERIRNILKLVRLEDYGNRKPAELSGGQQQRVALARALVPEPDMLLMDEPLSSLDQDLNVRLRGEILRLQQQLGFTLLHVTHDRDEAFALAVRVAIMDHGKVAFIGTVEDARNRTLLS